MTRVRVCVVRCATNSFTLAHTDPPTTNSLTKTRCCCCCYPPPLPALLLSIEGMGGTHSDARWGLCAVLSHELLHTCRHSFTNCTPCKRSRWCCCNCPNRCRHCSTPTLAHRPSHHCLQHRLVLHCRVDAIVVLLVEEVGVPAVPSTAVGSHCGSCSLHKTAC